MVESKSSIVRERVEKSFPKKKNPSPEAICRAMNGEFELDLVVIKGIQFKLEPRDFFKKRTADDAAEVILRLWKMDIK